jgi:hypothetical protein
MSSRSKKRLKAARKQAAADLGISYISRNDPCPCGSGKKAKHCCLNKIKMLKALPPAVREQLMVARVLQNPTLGTGNLPAGVPAAVAEQFAAVQTQAAQPVEAAAGSADAPVAEATSVDATVLPVDAPIAASIEAPSAPADLDDAATAVAQQMATDALADDGPPAEFPVPGVTIPIASATIQADGCDPIQLTGGTLTINPTEATS